MAFIFQIQYHFKSISKYQTYHQIHFKISNLSFHLKNIFILFNLKIPFQFTFQNISIPNKLLHLNHLKKMKLLHLKIKLLNFQNFQLSKFIFSLNFITTVKIQLSQHLKNVIESFIQNSSI